VHQVGFIYKIKSGLGVVMLLETLFLRNMGNHLKTTCSHMPEISSLEKLCIKIYIYNIQSVIQSVLILNVDFTIHRCH